MPGALLSAFNPYKFTMRSDWYYAHFIDGEIEAREIKGPDEGHNPSKWQRQESTSGRLSPKLMHTAFLNSNN